MQTCLFLWAVSGCHPISYLKQTDIEAQFPSVLLYSSYSWFHSDMTGVNSCKATHTTTKGITFVLEFASWDNQGDHNGLVGVNQVQTQWIYTVRLQTIYHVGRTANMSKLITINYSLVSLPCSDHIFWQWVELFPQCSPPGYVHHYTMITTTTVLDHPALPWWGPPNTWQGPLKWPGPLLQDDDNDYGSPGYLSRKALPIKCNATEPLTCKDIQFNILHIFSDTFVAFTSQTPSTSSKVDFCNLYINVLYHQMLQSTQG